MSEKRFGEGKYTLEELRLNKANTEKRIAETKDVLNKESHLDEFRKLQLENELKKLEKNLAYYIQVAKEAGLKI